MTVLVVVVVPDSSGSGELLVLLFKLFWLFVICRRSSALNDATLDSISDCECLRKWSLNLLRIQDGSHPCRSSISSSSRHLIATFLFLSGTEEASPEILGRRELGGHVETIVEL